MNRFVKYSFFVVASLYVAVVVPVAHAQVAALNFASAGISTTNLDTVRGYSFGVTGTGFTATYLSFYDQGGDGLADAHNIGLWDTTGSLIASAAVSAGTANALDATGKFRQVPITPTFLAAGFGYIVGATSLAGSQDNQATTFVDIRTASNISYSTGRFINGSTPGVLVRPTVANGSGLPGGSFGGFAGNIVTAAPEPASLALLAFGAVPILTRYKRAK